MRYKGQRVLVVGDGNLSFSLALSTSRGGGCGLVATTLEPREELTAYYNGAFANIKGEGARTTPFSRVRPLEPLHLKPQHFSPNPVIPSESNLRDFTSSLHIATGLHFELAFALSR